MALATVLTFGSGPLIEPLARALAEGAALHSTEVTTHHLDAMNRLLYRWGAVIVSPGYADDPTVHWLDNRPGVDTRFGEALDAAERQGRRLASLVAMIGGAISRLEKLQL